MARFGRKKNRIEKIQNKKQRNVKFSKRRTGLFKKESELSTLCDSLSTIVIVNPPANIYGTNSSLTVPRENATRKVNSKLLDSIFTRHSEAGVGAINVCWRIHNHHST
ncbi:agamous-like MADS-box protein AGL27 [Solanum stenotomum]|uniref:agamous-like MADS-box protein AGL27 n=1 Tax=Solanum stenotomum TaxID=172797 RepID=UPI0020D17C14|nr:agamous-like MADS-box protein AGL27 [Solanum stenotomum]